MYFRAVSAMGKRGENPASLERLGSMQVPVCILTGSPLISSWHWFVDWFMPPLAKLLEILPFLHLQCLCPQWERSTAVAVGQLDACLWPHWSLEVPGRWEHRSGACHGHLELSKACKPHGGGTQGHCTGTLGSQVQGGLHHGK